MQKRGRTAESRGTGERSEIASVQRGGLVSSCCYGGRTGEGRRRGEMRVKRRVVHPLRNGRDLPRRFSARLHFRHFERGLLPPQLCGRRTLRRDCRSGRSRRRVVPPRDRVRRKRLRRALGDQSRVRRNSRSRQVRDDSRWSVGLVHGSRAEFLEVFGSDVGVAESDFLLCGETGRFDFLVVARGGVVPARGESSVIGRVKERARGGGARKGKRRTHHKSHVEPLSDPWGAFDPALRKCW